MPTSIKRPIRCPRPSCPSNQGKAEPRVIRHSVNSGPLGRRRRRLCRVCNRTFSETTGTAYARLRRPKSHVDRAIEMQAEGMTKAAIARVLGVSPSTVSRWSQRAAAHARAFHEQFSKPTEASEVQMDELSCRGIGEAKNAWIYSSIEVGSRLWNGLLVALRTLRNTRLFVREVRDTLSEAQGWTVVTSDRFKYYEPAMRTVFKGFPIAYQQVHNQYRGGRIIRSESRRVLGSDLLFEYALQGQTHSQRPNTSFIERLNLRKRMCCSLVRRRNPAPGRSIPRIQEAMELVRVFYNYVRRHSSLRSSRGNETPAMAAGITDRPLRIREILGWVVPGGAMRQAGLRRVGSDFGVAIG